MLGVGVHSFRLKTDIMQADDYLKIDRYIQGELPEAERVELEARLQEEADLAAELELRQQMNTYLRTQAQKPALEQKMAALGQEHFGQMDKVKIRQLARRRLLYVVATAAVFALLLFVWDPFASTDLYRQFAQHPPLALVEKGSAEELANQAEQAFEQEDYAQAYEALAELQSQFPDDPQLQLGLGVSALETERLAEARRYFETLANGQTALQEYGQWYLILCLVKEENTAEAKDALATTTFTDPYLAEQANLLQAELE